MKKLFLALCFLAVNGIAFAQKAPVPQSDSVQIKTTLTAFYKWYQTGWRKLSGFKLYKSKSTKEGPPYVIDWKEAERYFNYIRKNVPYLGEGFIEFERRHYKSSEADFKKFPEDELPSGFDYDPFTNSQEGAEYFYSELIKKAKKWRITVQPQGTAHVTVANSEGDLFFCADLAKEKGKWKIAGTACETAVAKPAQKN